MATVNEALDAAASMIADLAGATVRKGIVSAGELDTSDVRFLQLLQMLIVSLVQNFLTRM